MPYSTLQRFHELPRIPAAVQLTTLPSVTAEAETCWLCGEPGNHHHALDRYRVKFNDATIIVRVPLSLTQSEIANRAWDELGRALPRPRFIAVEYLAGAWSDDSAAGRSEIEWLAPSAERKGQGRAEPSTRFHRFVALKEHLAGIRGFQAPTDEGRA